MLHAEGDSGYTPESRASSEIFTSKVVKVYSFQDGDAEYVAYVVTWKDHEVVVTSFGTGGADKPYNVGDVIRCQMQQMYHRVGDTGKARIIFSIMPGGPAVTGTADEEQRLEAVRAEVETRRLKRASTGPAPQPATP